MCLLKYLFDQVNKLLQKQCFKVYRYSIISWENILAKDRSSVNTKTEWIRIRIFDSQACFWNIVYKKKKLLQKCRYGQIWSTIRKGFNHLKQKCFWVDFNFCLFILISIRCVSCHATNVVMTFCYSCVK